MKNLLAVILLLTMLGCQDNAKKSSGSTPLAKEVKAEQKLEKSVEKDYEEKETDSTFRDITGLKKYTGFTKVVGQVLDGTERAIVYLQKDSMQVLVLEEIIRNNSAKVSYRILDEVQLISESTYLFSEPSSCEISGIPDEKFVFGIVNDQDKEYFDQENILKVWKVDLKLDKFIEVEKSSVKCFNHWFGYDG